MRPGGLRPASVDDRPDRSQANSRGTYTILEQLGTGGMASVHRAERKVGGVRQRVALKRLLPHAAQDPELVDLFLHEARVVSRLRHRNIAEIYEAGRLGDECFLAMELVTGPTVNHLLRCCSETVGPIPFPIVLKLLTQVCDALAYAHASTDDSGRPLGLVHRDISPTNIVISANGVVKLIDFGIAKSSNSHTQAGIIKGKLGYVAPEYLAGSIDHRADLWAVGVVAWEMLTGCRLFKADDDLTTVQLVRSQPIDPPSVHNPDVPPDLDAIVMSALHRDPDERWQNAGAMSTALAGVARPSSNAELVEWVEWVLKLSERGARPLRGSRPLPLPAMKAQRLVLTAAPDVEPLPAMKAQRLVLTAAPDARSQSLAPNAPWPVVASPSAGTPGPVVVTSPPRAHARAASVRPKGGVAPAGASSAQLSTVVASPPARSAQRPAVTTPPARAHARASTVRPPVVVALPSEPDARHSVASTSPPPGPVVVASPVVPSASRRVVASPRAARASTSRPTLVVSRAPLRPHAPSASVIAWLLLIAAAGVVVAAMLLA